MLWDLSIVVFGLVSFCQIFELRIDTKTFHSYVTWNFLWQVCTKKRLFEVQFFFKFHIWQKQYLYNWSDFYVNKVKRLFMHLFVRFYLETNIKISMKPKKLKWVHLCCKFSRLFFLKILTISRIAGIDIRAVVRELLN